jgi:hypothetical protein
VLVAEEMVLARLNPGGAPWAAQRYWVSEKAKRVCHNFPGFHKGGKWIRLCVWSGFIARAELGCEAFADLRSNPVRWLSL